MPADPGTPEWRDQVRAKISDAYYDARNAGRTMEDAADAAADAVVSDALAALEAREQQIQKALAFYADEHRWCDPDVRTCGCRFTEFCDDVANGEHPSSVARAALRELRPEGQR